jgi:hypothetical protein
LTLIWLGITAVGGRVGLGLGLPLWLGSPDEPKVVAYPLPNGAALRGTF